MGAQVVSHAVAEEGSPRHEPWGKCALTKAPSGAAELRPKRISFAASRLRLPIPQPTADAVGYLLPLLRSYLSPFSRTDLLRAT